METEIISAISATLISYQAQLSQMELALLTGGAVLFFANRKNKGCLPIRLTIAGSSMSASSIFIGLKFTEKIVNQTASKTLIKSDFATMSNIQYVLIILSAVFLILAAYYSEVEP